MQSFLKSKHFQAINILPTGAILILARLTQSSFEGVCAIAAVLFWLVQFWLFSIMSSGKSQKKKFKAAGYILLFPSIMMIGIGILLLLDGFLTITSRGAYTIIGLSCVLSLCLILQVIVHWSNNAPVGKFFKWTSLASLAVPMSIIIVVLLYITGSNEAITLSCLTVVIFGSSALLVAINMILVSSYGYKSIIDSIKTILLLIKENKLVFTRASIAKDCLLVVGKAAISLISLSFFMLVNAMHSAGMGIARFIAVKMHTQDRKKQISSYRYVGIIISFSSICYVLYSVRLFFGGSTGTYTMNIALVIALYTFIEFGINIREAFLMRKSKALDAKALRAISFSSTLLCFVLTHTAIMSFANEGDNSFSNALSGVVFGGLSALTGLYVILDSFSHKK